MKRRYITHATAIQRDQKGSTKPIKALAVWLERFIWETDSNSEYAYHYFIGFAVPSVCRRNSSRAFRSVTLICLFSLRFVQKDELLHQGLADVKEVFDIPKHEKQSPCRVASVKVREILKTVSNQISFGSSTKMTQFRVRNAAFAKSRYIGNLREREMENVSVNIVEGFGSD